MVEKNSVVVVGCGIAGLSAAVSAAEFGADVTLLERSTKEERGGNTRWTEAFMRMKNEKEVADDFIEHFVANAGCHLDPSLINETARNYSEWPSIVKALSFADPEVISTLATEAGPTLSWLKEYGIQFSVMPTYLLTQSTTRICPVGGGLALIDALADRAEKLGVKFQYETTAVDLVCDDQGAVAGIRARKDTIKPIEVMGKVILASGGFEGNAEMQARYYGERARYIRPVARGGYYNRGEGLRMALNLGASTCGDFSEYHAQPIDPRSGVSEPIVFNFPYGILVDREGRRFIDEASNTVDAIYENVARTINKLPGGVAYLICDARLDEVDNWQRSVRSDQKPIMADTLQDLATQLEIPVASLTKTVVEFNAATSDGPFSPFELDGLATEYLNPPKSNWALPIAIGPFRAWPVSSANCFTFGGLRCNANAQILDGDGRPIPDIYAAGETMGLYYKSYTGATSVLRGAVFGRIAGRHASGLAS
jgi:tricarballylate dehydrogenase